LAHITSILPNIITVHGAAKFKYNVWTNRISLDNVMKAFQKTKTDWCDYISRDLQTAIEIRNAALTIQRKIHELYSKNNMPYM